MPLMPRTESGDRDRRYAKKRWLVASAALREDQQVLVGFQCNELPCPRPVPAFIALASVGMLKSPPASISREFPATQTVGLSVSCKCCHEVEKVKDNLRTSIRVQTQGDKGSKSVSSHLGILERLAVGSSGIQG